MLAKASIQLVAHTLWRCIVEASWTLAFARVTEWARAAEPSPLVGEVYYVA